MGIKVKPVFHKEMQYDIEIVDDHYVVVNTQRPRNHKKPRKGPAFEMERKFVSIEEAEDFIKNL